jgi:hypothetical protein
MTAEFVSRSSIPDERLYVIRLLGTGAADPTVEIGAGVTAPRQATGVYRVTIPKNPGTFIGVRGYVFGAATPGDVKGQTLTRDTWTAPTASASGYLDIAVWSSTFAADDLQATEYLDLTIAFSEDSQAR